MQTITSLACKITKFTVNCITSLIFRGINTISLKPEELDSLCLPTFIDTQKITINYYKLPYEEQRAYVDAYKQVVEMQGLVIADLEQQLKIANNIINGYKRLLPVECPLKYGFAMKRQVHTYENVEFKNIEYGFIKRKIHNYVIIDVYNFGNAKVSYCGENFVFEYDDTFIDADVSSATCECEEPIQKETIQLCKVKEISPKIKEKLPELEYKPPTDDDNSEEDSFDWSKSEVVQSLKQTKPIYVAGLEYKSPEEKEAIAKSNNTTVEYLHPINESPNVYTQFYICCEEQMYRIIRDIHPMVEFERYVKKLEEGKRHFPSDMSVILTHMYIELSKRNDRLRASIPRNITTIHYEDDVHNKVYKHYTARLTLTFDVNGHVNYYVKFEIETKDGKKHESSNNISNSFNFIAYRY